MDLFPAGWRIVRRHDANCFYFVNLSAPYFVDVHGRHIKGLLIGHIGFGPVRVARDFEFFLRHRMMEMRKTDRQSRNGVGDYHAAILD